MASVDRGDARMGGAGWGYFPVMAGSADDLVMRAVAPTTPRWMVYLYAFQAALGVHLAFGDPAPWRWGAVGFWLLSAAFFAVLRRREQRHGARLTLSADGLVFTPVLGRTRTYPWEDVERLDVDPPGGPRFAHLSLRSGRWHRLLVVPDEQVDAVKARWAAVQAQRRPTADRAAS